MELNIKTVIDSISCSSSYEDSYKKLKQIYQYVEFDKIIENPIKLFDIHLPFCYRPDLMDISIRFTVQMNLFAGSIINFGTDAHRKLLNDKSIIGCFALTERTAGITSGMYIKTRCDYNTNTGKYILNTHNYNNRKIWISQGLFARYCVVFTEYYINNKYHGIQPFLITLRDENMSPHTGVVIELMSQKHIIKNLDNVSITFNNFEIPSTAIMNRKPCNTFLDIADRLLTGRIILSECAIQSAKRTLDSFYKDYVSKKEIFINRNHHRIKLKNIDRIQKVFDNYNRQYILSIKMIAKTKLLICDNIKNNTRPTRKTIELINTTKIHSIELVYNTMSLIQRYMGSQSLLNEFVNPTIYIPFLVAEGSTDILRQKLVSDNMYKLTKHPLRYITQTIKGNTTISEMYYTTRLLVLLSIHKNKELYWLSQLNDIDILSNIIITKNIKASL